MSEDNGIPPKTAWYIRAAKALAASILTPIALISFMLLIIAIPLCTALPIALNSFFVSTFVMFIVGALIICLMVVVFGVIGVIIFKPQNLIYTKELLFEEIKRKDGASYGDSDSETTPLDSAGSQGDLNTTKDGV